MSEATLITVLVADLVAIAMCGWGCYYGDKHDAVLLCGLSGVFGLLPIAMLCMIIGTAMDGLR